MLWHSICLSSARITSCSWCGQGAERSDAPHPAAKRKPDVRTTLLASEQELARKAQTGGYFQVQSLLWQAFTRFCGALGQLLSSRSYRQLARTCAGLCMLRCAATIACSPRPNLYLEIGYPTTVKPPTEPWNPHALDLKSYAGNRRQLGLSSDSLAICAGIKGAGAR